LRDVIDRTEALTGCSIERAYVDKGYRGHDAQNPRRVFISGQKRGVFGVIKRELRRRSAIEPVIGHMKTDGHLGRCYLKGRAGDAANVVLSAVGHNFRRILAWLRDLLRLAHRGIVDRARPTVARAGCHRSDHDFPFWGYVPANVSGVLMDVAWDPAVAFAQGVSSKTPGQGMQGLFVNYNGPYSPGRPPPGALNTGEAGGSKGGGQNDPAQMF
jgi:IS5 family transposase